MGFTSSLTLDETQPPLQRPRRRAAFPAREGVRESLSVCFAEIGHRLSRAPQAAPARIRATRTRLPHAMRIQVLLGLGAAVLLAGTVAAQTVSVRTLPEDAKRAQLSHVRENVMSLDGRETQARAGRADPRRGTTCSCCRPGCPATRWSSISSTSPVELYRAWILTAEEAARPDKSRPASVQGRPVEEALPQYDPARPLRFGEKPAPPEASPASTDN